MKQEIDDMLKVFSEFAVKYGFWIAIVVLAWVGFKRVWFWTIMPMMFLVFLNQLAVLYDWQFVSKLNVVSLIVSWVFVFSLLRYIGGLFFEKT